MADVSKYRQSTNVEDRRGEPAPKPRTRMDDLISSLAAVSDEALLSRFVDDSLDPHLDRIIRNAMRDADTNTPESREGIVGWMTGSGETMTPTAAPTWPTPPQLPLQNTATPNDRLRTRKY